MKKNGSYFISAGEFSGDIIATELVHQINGIWPRLKSYGVAGPSMRDARVRSIVDMEKFEVLGFVEVISKLPDILEYESIILQELERTKPEFAVLVDYPGFHIHLAEKIKALGIPVIQYVAPKVWAWGEKRVSKIRERFDLVLGILPFEEEFYKSNGVSFKFVGSPHKDRLSNVNLSKKDFGFSDNKKLVACLPGSRQGEIKKILPLLEELSQKLDPSDEKMEFIVPLAESFDFSWLKENYRSSNNKIVEKQGSDDFPFDYLQLGNLKIVSGMSLELMKISDAAIVASGTATLECFLLGCPLVVIYKMNEISYQLAKRVMKVPYVSLVNLFANKEVVKEFIHKFDIEDVVSEVEKILEDQSYTSDMKSMFNEMKNNLKGRASYHAALEIKEFLEKPFSSGEK